MTRSFTFLSLGALLLAACGQAEPDLLMHVERTGETTLQIDTCDPDDLATPCKLAAAVWQATLSTKNPKDVAIYLDDDTVTKLRFNFQMNAPNSCRSLTVPMPHAEFDVHLPTSLGSPLVTTCADCMEFECL
jgi:hypothetical protein